jgi:FdhD protein
MNDDIEPPLLARSERDRSVATAQSRVMAQRRGGAVQATSRTLPEETPIAIVHDAATYAVMMATPADLEDFAIGLSLTEEVIHALDDVMSFEAVTTPLGIEARLWLKPGRAAALAGRRRMMAGPTGCGLCGVESLALAARRSARTLEAIPLLTTDDIHTAMTALDPEQVLGKATRAVHAAGLWRAGRGMVAVREDVGRHNAVDKLAGALARRGETAAGVLTLTSRVSVELVQKAAAIGAPVIAAVSAPTALAVRTADAAGITLVGVARADGFEVFTHAQRIAGLRVGVGA